ncbi:hypothetical protein AB9E09_17430 [Rhizobium leguminosarum]|uniref:hypothetical protein n=1 Tax=Rhizobium leguminosarum TaxID=384 RepID=UPI003F996A61
MAEADKPNSMPKITQGRSPAYPYIPLSKAIDRLERVVAAGVGRNAYPAETFYKIWELGSQSSGARQTMAALNHFGLVDYDGRGEIRKVKLSDLALKIALDKVPGSAERAAALQLAALTPSIHSDLYQKYRWLLPADVVLQTYLTRDRGYNPTAAESLIDEYKDTLVFAGLDKPASEEDSVEAAADGSPPTAAKVGDHVLIEIDGTLLFAEPKRVEEIREHEGELWVFVEGEKGAVKMDQVTVQNPTLRQAAVPPVRELPPPSGAQGVAPENGEIELFRSRVGAATNVRLLVKGDLGAKEIGKLITILEAQKKVLEED